MCYNHIRSDCSKAPSVFLQQFKNLHKVMSETTLHHDPVDSTGQIYVRGQEDDVLAL